MREHLDNYGVIYELIVALIFGVVGIILWVQDRKKSFLIKTLQEQSKTLNEQFQIFLNQDTPSLNVNSKEYLIGVEMIKLEIKNEGSQLYDLEFNGFSAKNIFEIRHLLPPKNIARKNSFEIQVKHIKNKNEVGQDILTFSFKDRFGNKFNQVLYLCSLRENIAFEAPEKTIG